VSSRRRRTSPVPRAAGLRAGERRGGRCRGSGTSGSIALRRFEFLDDRTGCRSAAPARDRRLTGCAGSSSPRAGTQVDHQCRAWSASGAAGLRNRRRRPGPRRPRRPVRPRPSCRPVAAARFAAIDGGFGSIRAPGDPALQGSRPTHSQASRIWGISWRGTGLHLSRQAWHQPSAAGCQVVVRMKPKSRTAGAARPLSRVRVIGLDSGRRAWPAASAHGRGGRPPRRARVPAGAGTDQCDPDHLEAAGPQDATHARPRRDSGAADPLCRTIETSYRGAAWRGAPEWNAAVTLRRTIALFRNPRERVNIRMRRSKG